MNRVLRMREALDEALEEAVKDVAEDRPVPVLVENEAAVSGVNIEHLRMTEALLFAASEPLSEAQLASSLPEGADVAGLLAELQRIYEGRGITLVRVAEKWQFRTASDLSFLLRK